MNEVIFLIVLALIWVIFAVVQDLRNREVANWLNFSLIVFAVGFRFFYCLFSEIGFQFFYQGLYGLGIFFILGNLLYYGRMFAGGDAKLMIALGAVLPFSEIFSINIKIFTLFFLAFLISGAVYGLGWSVFLGVKNFKEFKKHFFKIWKKNQKLVVFVMMFGGLLIIIGLIFSIVLIPLLSSLIFLLPILYVYAKAVDEACMIKKIRTSQLTEGDWLYNNVKVGRKLIKAKWDGVSKKDIQLIKKKFRVVKIRQGIPFTPVFLISFLMVVYIWFSGRLNELWGLV